MSVSRINPISIYSLGFVVASFMALYFREEWSMEDFSKATVMLILVGVLPFTFVGMILYKISPIKVRSLSDDVSFDVKTGFLRFILLYKLVYFVLYYQLVLGGVNLSSLSNALLDSRSLDSLPPLIQRMDLVSEIFTYYVEFLFAKTIALGNKCNNKGILISIVFICIISTLLSGAKGYAVYQIIYICIVWAVIKAKKNPFNLTPISKKVLFKYVGLSILFVLLFSFIADLQGRGHELGPLYYFAIYCGGQFKNLDMLMDSYGAISSIFGEYSFHLNKADIDTLKEFNVNGYVNGLELGNLATALRYYYQDFRLIGTGVLVSCISFFMYFLYKKAFATNELNNRNFSIWIFLFAYIGRGLALSFFTETFFLMWMSVYQIRTIILIILFAFFVEKIGFVKVKKIEK